MKTAALSDWLFGIFTLQNVCASWKYPYKSMTFRGLCRLLHKLIHRKCGQLGDIFFGWHTAASCLFFRQKRKWLSIQGLSMLYRPLFTVFSTKNVQTVWTYPLFPSVRRVCCCCLKNSQNKIFNINQRLSDISGDFAHGFPHNLCKIPGQAGIVSAFTPEKTVKRRESGICLIFKRKWFIF